MKNQAILAAALAISCAAVACSSSGTSTTSTGSGGGAATGTTTAGTGGTGAGGGPVAPASSCVQKGGKGNDIGVGEYCTPGGGECAAFDKAGLCLADVGQDQWMCTRIGCKVDADCGTAAHCHFDPAGAGCVPDKCEMVTTSSTGSGSSSASTGTGAGGSK